MTGDVWTEPRVEQLKTLWAEGLSCSHIASIIGEGVTRNAVIGKVSRLRLPKRNKVSAFRAPKPASPRSHTPRFPGKRPAGHVRLVSSTASKPATASERALEPDDRPLGLDAVFDIPVAQRRTLVQLTEHTCKWPVGDPLTPDFYFCGGEALEGKPYCAFHARRAYYKIEPQKAAAPIRMSTSIQLAFG